MATAILAKDGFVWQQGMTSNVGAWSLVDSTGFTVAHVYQGNDKKWCAVDGEGTVINEHTTITNAIRAAILDMTGADR